MKQASFQVAVIMGSKTDLKTMRPAIQLLQENKVRVETKIVSAHRTPHFMQEYSESLKDRGVKIVIAGAGGAAHLPGMVASFTTLPVIGVPISTKSLKGLDSLLSIAQMPKGVPVACMAIDQAFNAGLLALRILSLSNQALSKKVLSYSKKIQKASLNSNKEIKKLLKL